MKLVVIAVGRLKEPEFRALCDGYLKRIRRHFPIEEVEVPDGPAASLVRAIERHAEGAHLVALEAAGRELGREILDRASVVWSLSRLTFPHRLARLVLVEQLYRATAILRNEPYAH